MIQTKIKISKSDQASFKEAGERLIFGKVGFQDEHVIIEAACMEDICRICFMAGYVNGSGKSYEMVQKYFRV